LCGADLYDANLYGIKVKIKQKEKILEVLCIEIEKSRD